MRHVFSKSLSILLIVAVSLLFVSCSKKTSSVNNSSNYDYELSEEHIVTDDETGLQYVNNILIVYFKDSASDSDVSSVVSDVNGKIVGQYSESNQIQIEVPVKDMSELESLCDSLMERDYVDYCTYDYVYHNLGSMKSRYIAAIPGGDVEKILVEEGALLLEANEKIAVYDRRPDETN